jgi:hypothetical protein
MAHKKAKKHKVGARRRRRRIHGISPALMDAGMKFLGVGLGAVGEVFINSAVKTNLPSLPTWSGGGVGVAAGLAGFAFAGKSAFFQGLAGGLAGMGAVFVMNETFLSLPGISGTPQGVPNARAIPGNYISTPVGYRAISKNNVGNLSNGPSSNAVGNLYRN